MLGIVIVAYKNHSETIRFVLEELPKITTEHVVVIVDNASTEEKSRALAEAIGGTLSTDVMPEDRVFIISEEENLGFAKGNNIGFEFLQSHFDIDKILFTNDDIELTDSHCVEYLIEKLDSLENVGCIGPRVLGRDGRDQSPHRHAISIYRQIGWNLFPFLRRKKKVVDTEFPRIPPSGYCYWVSGAFMLMRSEVFVQAAMFDPNTFLYCEEMILAEKMRAVGYKFYFENGTTILHYEGSSTKKDTTSAETRKRLINSNCYYYKTYKNKTFLSIWLYRFSTWVRSHIYR